MSSNNITRALTLTQPWASLIATGHKQIETRSWTTAHRGWLAIHAALGYPAYAREFAREVEPLLGSGVHYIGNVPGAPPLGAIVAVARLVAVHPTFNGQFVDENGRFCDVSPVEQRLGDFATGRYAWIFEDVRALAAPIPCRGALGLWRLPPQVAAQLPEPSPPNQ